MAVTAVEVRTANGQQLMLPLDSIDSGYSVQDISGLDPVPATIVSSNYANQDGEQYHSSRRGKRNIVLKLGLEPDFVENTVRELRNVLYQFLMPKSEVVLRFYSDDIPTVEIVGRVETFEAPLFVEEPLATISVLCFLPDFIDLTPIRLNGNSVADFSESIVEYDGTSETGFVFNLLPDRAITEFSVRNRAQDGIDRTMDLAIALGPGDTLEISTVPGSKGVTLIRAGLRISVLYALSAYSDWINFYPGQNHFRVTTPGAPIPFIVDYTTKYGGL